MTFESQAVSEYAEYALPCVLVVESDPQMSKLLHLILKGKDREIYLTHSISEAQSILDEKQVDLVLLDLSLPGDDGRNFLLSLRTRATTALLPVIILSGIGGNLSKIESYVFGVDVFLDKPVAPELLKAVITARLYRALEIRRESRQDPFTGLPNRVAFQENFLRFVSLSVRRREPIALGLIGCDEFLRMKKQYGPFTSDSMLKHTATILCQLMRQSDLLAQWNGLEFAILFPGTSLDGARRALSKALQVLRNEYFPLPNGEKISLPFSAGVIPVNKGFNFEEVMSEAARFLSLARNSGTRHLVSEKNKPRGLLT